MKKYAASKALFIESVQSVNRFGPMNTTTAARPSFPVLAIGALSLVIVIGFARTYYLRFLIDQPPMTVAVHIHGLLSTLWLILHFTQAKLIAANEYALHRRLGIFAAVVGAAMVVQGADMAIQSAANGHAPPGRDPVQFLTVSLGGATMFGAFLAGALLLRRKREWHQRLMFLASCVLILPAVGRLQFFFDQISIPRRLVPLLVTIAFVAWPMVNEWRKRGRVHPAWWIGGAVLIFSIPFRGWLGETAWWLPIGRWLVA
jgi:hypothetical protein